MLMWLFGFITGIFFEKILEIKRSKNTKLEKETEQKIEYFDRGKLVKEFSIEMPAKIKYIDADGNVTERTINIKSASLYTSGDVLLLAYCLLREEPRSFYTSRMKQFIDLNTGEIIADPASYIQEKAAA